MCFTFHQCKVLLGIRLSAGKSFPVWSLSQVLLVLDCLKLPKDVGIRKSFVLRSDVLTAAEDVLHGRLVLTYCG